MAIEKRIVVPGEVLIENDTSRAFKTGVGVYRENGKVVASTYGLLNKTEDFVKVVPLHGTYTPRRGDFVIGIITDVKFKGCFVDINSPYSAYLPIFRDGEYNFGDVTLAKIAEVDEVKNVTLGDARKLYNGRLVEIESVKIPRVVGKNGSMLTVLKEKTGCDIFVGRNGRLWVKGEDRNILKAEQSLLKIEREAHTPGLTGKISEFLDKWK
jgi:exosome complex component RRP4